MSQVVVFEDDINMDRVGRIEVRANKVNEPVSAKIWLDDDTVQNVTVSSFDPSAFELLESRFSGVNVYVMDIYVVAA